MIQAWLAKAGATLWAYALAAGAAFLVVFGFYQNAKRKGALTATQKQAKAEVKRVDKEAVRRVEAAQATAEVQVETIQAAKNESDKVNSLDTGVAADKLRDEWARD